MKMLDYGIELSFLTLKYPTYRGNTPAILTSIGREGALQPYTYMAFSVHSLSHMDLPWCIETQIEEMRRFDPTLKPLPKPERMNEVMKFYSTIKVFKTVVIDITDKQKKLMKYVSGNSEVLKSDISSDSFEDLMQVLKITKKDIEEKISLDKLTGKFILFKTNYDLFSGRAADFSNSYFEFRYPYLLAPYFEYGENLLTQMIDELKIAGIGSDSYGLENPIYFVNRHNLPRYAIDYYEKYNRRRKLPFAPVLAKLMTEQKYYLKNLKNLRKIKTDKYYAFGELTVIPFAFGNRDANGVRAFFRGEDDENE